MDNFKEKADTALATLRLLRKSGEITLEVYCKMIMKLCFEHIKQNDSEEALLLLRGLPSEYFEETLMEQMEEDSEFCDLSYKVACALVDSKKVDNNDIEVNMKGGLA